MPTMPPPTGLPPGFTPSFAWLAVVGSATAIVIVAALATLLWALRARDRVSYRVRCPTRGGVARIEVWTSGDGREDVGRCSLCRGAVDCEKTCLRLVG